MYIYYMLAGSLCSLMNYPKSFFLVMVIVLGTLNDLIWELGVEKYLF